MPTPCNVSPATKIDPKVTNYYNCTGPVLQLFNATTDALLYLFKSASGVSCLRRLAQFQKSVKNLFDNHFHAVNSSMELAEVILIGAFPFFIFV